MPRAVVVGGGISGVLAAAALHRAGHPTVILEQDPLAVGLRRGAPHAAQLHNLLARAQRHIPELLPGFRDALLSAGGVAADVAADTHVWELGVRMPERSVGLQLWSAPQTVLERVAHRVLPPGIEMRDGVRVTGLVQGDRGIEGVEVETPDGLATIEAQFVVDATGAGSATSRWLPEPPPVESHAVRQWYCTSVVERPRAWVGRPDFWLAFPDHPQTRGALISPWGEHRWYVSVSGVAGDPAPRTFDEVRAFVAGLPDRRVADALADAQVISEPRTFGKPTATWRHWERLARPVAGLLPIGDAVGSLNPLFGQGVSVAAWQAAELARTLAETADRAALTATYLQRAAAACRAAWSLMHVYAPPEESALPQLSAPEWEDVAALVCDDVDAHRRFVGMWHLLEPTSILRDLVPAVRPAPEPAP